MPVQSDLAILQDGVLETEFRDVFSHFQPLEDRAVSAQRKRSGQDLSMTRAGACPIDQYIGSLVD